VRASPLVHGDEVLLPRARVRQGAAQRGATSTRLHAALVPPEQRNAAHLETRGLGVELVQAPRGGRGRLGAPRGRQQRRERTQRIAAQRARGRRQA